MNRRGKGLREVNVLVGLLSVWIGARPVLAQESPPKPVAVSKPVEHRPTAIPDRIVLTWTGDPARSQAVSWRTDTSVRTPLAQLALAEAGPLFVPKAKDFPALTTPLTTDLGEAYYHTAHFIGLTPKTKYVYRVGDGVNWSEWVHFHTASAEPEPFSFIYFGDAQNDIKAHWSRVIREAYSDAPKARFIIHAGDLINRANRDAEWGEWFNAGGWINAMVPSIPTPGNHEYEAAGGAKADDPKVKRLLLSRHWRTQFALPENGPSGLEETVYYLDYQGVRIVSLNSNEQQDRQVAWLEEVLSNNPNRWTILTFHHPIFSAAQKRDNPQLRRQWQPIFDKYRVDLVLQGHDHTYARSGPLTVANVPTGISVRDPGSGTVYVVSVSGPKMYRLERADWMKKSAENTQLYQVVTVDGGKLRYEARTSTGDLHDLFELRKRKEGTNALMEREELEAESRKFEAASGKREAEPDKPAALTLNYVLGAIIAVLLGLFLWTLKRTRALVRSGVQMRSPGAGQLADEVREPSTEVKKTRSVSS